MALAHSKNSKNKGFTLVELLVVIFILGVLASLVASNLQSARQRARDTRKKSELKDLQTAMRLYYNDYQKYPEQDFDRYFPACGADGTTRCSDASCDADFAAGGAGCETVYMQELPEGLGNGGVKYYSDNAEKYCLKLDGEQTLENLSDADLDASFDKCNTICEDLSGAALDPDAGEYAVCNQ